MMARHDRHLLAASAIVTAALAGVLLPLLNISSYAWPLVALALLVGLLPILVSFVKKRPADILEPAYLFGLSYVVLFGIRPVFDLLHGKPPFVGRDTSTTYSVALLVAVIGGTAFMVGYYSGFGTKIGNNLPAPASSWDIPSLNVLIIAMGLGVAALFLLFIATIGGLPVLLATIKGRNSISSAALQSSSGYLYSAPMLLFPLGILLLVTTSKWVSTRGVGGFILIFLSQLLNIGAGNRSYTIPALLSVAVLYLLLHQRRPRITLLAAALPLVFIFLITIPRELRYNDERSTGAIAAVTSSFTHFFTNMDFFFTSAETAMLPALAIEIQHVPDDIPYQWGATYIEALTRPIPRSIWPSKPLEGDVTLMRVIWPTEFKYGVIYTFSIFGEPYLNFGVPGVAAALAIFGVCWRALYVWLQRNPSNPLICAIYAISYPYLFVYLRGGIGVDYQRQLISLVPFLFAMLLIRRSATISKATVHTPRHSAG